MKTIKVKFVGFWDDFMPEKQLFYKMMCKHYDVQISDEPDYIICSCFGAPYQYCSNSQIRIMIVGENYLPDLNYIDYAIVRYPIQLLDRCFYQFDCLDENGHALALEKKDRNYSDDILAQKVYFANFIAGHESEYGIRGAFFEKLSEYKRIEAAGTYLNNMPEGKVVDFKDDSKCDFQKKCKFTLCFESTKHEGFITEKITDAFYADTIPIYYGSSTIVDIFNPESFINLSDYATMEEAIEKIKQIDQNDQLYLKMLRSPIYKETNYVSNLHLQLEEYICHIFEQSIENAFRRSRVYWPKKMEEYIVSTLTPSARADAIPFCWLVRSIIKRIIKKMKFI